MTSFGSFVRELREKADWPQRKLAHELDMDVSILSKIENENRYPRKKAAFIIGRLSCLFQIPEAKIKEIYLSDEIASILAGEENYEGILATSAEKVKQVRKKK
ncbi:MAG TPA: helix-turn-helix transcriptional regulator [Chitinophagaceae bacterium]|jgi:transcriptional regulator with XRE-family HTH domain|nr:helix-turn-helix transcriptional regulator [Chitinophagaceae bacterium]